MRVGYDADTDTMYLDIEPRPSTESFELCDGIVIDLDADRRVVGIEVERASRKLDVEGLRAAIEGAPRPA